MNDWHQFLAPPWADVLLCAAAMLCGALIGAEREKQVKPAGLRTMILICLGSAVFTMASLLLSEGILDKGRVAAQIVTGVGFLGAGSIIQAGGAVRGMTTAATIWAVAAIGMVIGAGYGTAGVALTLTVLLVLIWVTIVEDRYLGPCLFRKVVLIYDNADGKAGIKIADVLDEYMIGPDARQDEQRDDGTTQMTLTYCKAHKRHREFLVTFASWPEILSMEGPFD